MMVITVRNLFYLTPLTVLIVLLTASSYVFSTPTDANQLYKWKDSMDKWHYSKLPPATTSKELSPEQLEVAKDAKTIIFKKQVDKPIITNEDYLIKIQKERRLRSMCQTAQNNMLETANLYRMEVDKKFQEKNLSLEEYRKEKDSISKLEEIATDIYFQNYCMTDFIQKPQLKSITTCIIKDSTLDDRIGCLKELPQTE